MGPEGWGASQDHDLANRQRQGTRGNDRLGERLYPGQACSGFRDVRKGAEEVSARSARGVRRYGFPPFGGSAASIQKAAKHL